MANSNVILAGDIGATKSVLGLFVPSPGGVQLLLERTYASATFPSAKDLLARFRADVPTPDPQVACFGVAGPVIDGGCRTTNLPWFVDEESLAAALALGPDRVRLLNDLAATALGACRLAPEELVRLDTTGTQKQGNIAVIAAGSGLGEAILYWNGTSYHPIATEGGHVEFAPRTETEIRLLRFLWNMVGAHVSYERLLSGPGLHAIYRFLRADGPPEPAWLADRLRLADPSAVIAEAAIAQVDPVCSEALELFCSIYGAEAGNLALKCLATGGVYLAGGIAPKILPALRRGAFMRSFTDKGRFSGFLETVPVSVVMNDRTALLGAAHFSLRLLRAE